MDVDDILQSELLVYSIINKYNGYYDKEDLYQEGMKGLIKALKKYDSKRGVSFSTYAYKYILGEINKYVRENHNIRLSKEIVRLKRTIEKAKELMRQKLYREPTTLELSLFLEIDEEKIEEIETINQISEDIDEVENKIKVNDINTNADIIDLKNELSKLNDEEKQIIYDRFYKDMTQSETGEDLGISQAQVYRKENKILQKLKENL